MDIVNKKKENGNSTPNYETKTKQSKRSQPALTAQSHSRVSSEDSASMEFVNEFKKEIQDTDGFDCAMQENKHHKHMEIIQQLKEESINFHKRGKK